VEVGWQRKVSQEELNSTFNLNVAVTDQKIIDQLVDMALALEDSPPW
jgi:hypothetical protein